MITALFGGTFNPFHNGHKEILKKVCELPFIDRVFVIPDCIPPHKDCDFSVEDFHRVNMCKKVCENFEKASVLTLEIERKGKSYSIITVRELKEKYPNDKFYFVCGGDMIASLDTWYKWDELIKEIPFLAFNRTENSGFSDSVKRMKKLGADITVVDADIPEISSSAFRNNHLSSLLPTEVYEYIKENGLYNAR